MKIFWTFLMIVSSCFAIPVSCTSGMFAGAKYLSHYNTVYFSGNNEPQENFYILASDKLGYLDYFAYQSKHSAEKYLENYPDRSFFISENHGELVADASLKGQIILRC